MPLFYATIIAIPLLVLTLLAIGIFGSVPKEEPCTMKTRKESGRES